MDGQKHIFPFFTTHLGSFQPKITSTNGALEAVLFNFKVVRAASAAKRAGRMEQQLRAMAAELAFLKANNQQSNYPMQFPSFPGFADRGVYMNQGGPFLQGVPSYQGVPIQYGNPHYGNPQYGIPPYGGIPFAGRAAIMEADSRASMQVPLQSFPPPLPPPEVESVDNSKGGQSMQQTFSEELKLRMQGK